MLKNENVLAILVRVKGIWCKKNWMTMLVRVKAQKRHSLRSQQCWKTTQKICSKDTQTTAKKPQTLGSTLSPLFLSFISTKECEISSPPHCVESLEQRHIWENVCVCVCVRATTLFEAACINVHERARVRVHMLREGFSRGKIWCHRDSELNRIYKEEKRERDQILWQTLTMKDTGISIPSLSSNKKIFKLQKWIQLLIIWYKLSFLHIWDLYVFPMRRCRERCRVRWRI